jgi:geranylgeranyl reductase family protein
MPESYDVIIVGAGPAGCSTACHLRAAGVESVLLLDKAVFPRDKLCGGGLTRKAQRALEGMGALDSVRERAYEVPTTYVVTPRGSKYYERGDGRAHPTMLVLNRRVLDHTLLEHAGSRGVEIRQGVEVEELLKEEDRYLGVRTRDGERLEAGVVVVAAGAHSGRLVPGAPPSRRIVCYMGWFEGTAFEPNTAFLIYDESFLPQYGWMFPEGDDRVNVGVGLEASKCSARALRECYSRLLSCYLKPYMKSAKPVGRPRGFPIHYSYRVRDVVQGTALYVGEAGRMVDAMTGEGIAGALISGEFAAGAIAEYLKSGDVEHLRGYEAAVKRKFHRLASTRWVKALMNRRAGWRIIEAVAGRKARWVWDGWWVVPAERE